jgi:hypothetical protein
MKNRIFSAPRLLVLATCSLSFLAPTAGHASLLLGTVDFAGLTPVSIATDMINFGLPSGGFFVTSATGGFMPLLTTSGTVKNIDNPPYAINTIASTPNWVTFASAPNITFELTELLGGTFGTASCLAAPAPGQTCTPANSPYNLSNSTASSSTASFTVVGIEHDSTTGTSVAFSGIFTAQFANMNYQTILNDVSNLNQTIITSYSASFTTVPEPSTAFTLALGGFALVGAAVSRRRRKS